MEKLPLPPPTVDSAFPPNRNRIYFKDAAMYPFRPQAQAFELVNAWWLAEAALLAYADEAFVGQELARAGLQMTRFLSTSGTQCYVGVGGNFVIAAFRGSQVPKPGDDLDRERLFQEIVRDVDADVGFQLVDSGQGGHVHEGFKDSLDSVWSQFRDELLDHRRQRRSVWMTGHSLGAALATLAADRFGGVQALYTFGSPRVGDRAFADDFHVPAYRFVHNRDIVTRVPPFGQYKGKVGRADYAHVGALKYIDADGRLWDREPGTESLGGLTRDVVGSLFNQNARARLGHLLDITREPFDDHAPLYYALRIWNLYVDSRS